MRPFFCIILKTTHWDFEMFESAVSGEETLLPHVRSEVVVRAAGGGVPCM